MIRKLLRFKISTKVLIFFLVVSLLPLFSVTVVLVNTAKSSLLSAAETRQQVVANSTAASVDNYLGSKINTLVFQSQLLASQQSNNTEASQDLAVLVKQDPTLESVSLLNTAGQQQVLFNQQGEQSNLTNQSSSDAFKAVNFLAGKNYIGSVSYNSKNQPQIVIATPLLASNLNQNLNNLPAANFGTYTNSSSIQGVLVAEYNISGLWSSVLSTKVGQGGYAYVVDGLGNLVAHPSAKFLESHPNVSTVQAVSEYIGGNYRTEQTISELGKQVVSTPAKLALTNWAVIVEEPVSSIYSDINSFLKFSAAIIFVAMIFAIVMSLIFRRQLITPIRKLILGVRRIEGGEFDHAIDLNTKDEFQELANTFNSMGLSIQKLILDLKTKNFNLADEQNRLSNILRSVSDGIIALNSTGQIISINPPAAKLVGKTVEDLMNRPMVGNFNWKIKGKDFVPELKKPGLYHYSDLVLQHGIEVAYLDLMVTVIDNKESEVATIITVHDQTQSRELDVMKLDFVAIAAHELRTPVTVVQGYLSLLNKDALENMTVINIENLQKAINGTNQLRDLINKLLNISRVDRGEMDMHFEKLDLVGLVSEVCKQHDSMARTRQQTIKFDAGDNDYVYVPGDVSSLTEVLNNLISNALKYTGDGDTIKVNLKVDYPKDEVRVEVKDNGPGISPEHRSKLFTKFYRVERSLVAGNRGTGLGLYLAKSIIDLHHGKIGIDPFEGAGKGSTFFFTLPIFDEVKHSVLLSKDKEKVAGGIHGWFKKRNNS